MIVLPVISAARQLLTISQFSYTLHKLCCSITNRWSILVSPGVTVQVIHIKDIQHVNEEVFNTLISLIQKQSDDKSISHICLTMKY